MRLSELLPQPIRNIYHNYQQLNDPLITAERREETIQNISKDCFRLLLVLPMAVYSKVMYEATEKANSPFWLRMITFIPILALPATSMLYFAGGFAIVSIAALTQAIALKSLGMAGLSIGCGVAAAICSEKFETNQNDFLNMEDRLITPLSNQVARVFI
ncbi:MAG: hypothetical protein H0V82_11390 [Candidatus Protochlamydia sp.]|nr:hypothetical protein [Candidatus Protochlamydia sp.]